MKCILCNNNNFHIIIDYLRHDIRRNVVQCKNCSLVSLEDPANDDLDYSQANYRNKHTSIIGKTQCPQEFFDFSKPIFKKRVLRVKSFLKKDQTILEIGCSTGHFLDSVKTMVKKCIGIELEPNHAKFARENCHLEVYDKPLDEINLPLNHFDTIFMFQVFEHISNPIEFLSLCKNYLKSNGKIYLEVPNIDDALISIYTISSFKEFYFREPHRYYYSKKTLEKIMEKSGFIGTTRTIQEYSIFNHIHWLLNQQPQPNQQIGYGMLSWNCSNSNKLKQSEMLSKWFEKINFEYQRILEKEDLGEHVSFLGKMIKK